MKTLQFLLLYYWLKSQLLRWLKVKPKVSLSREDPEAVDLTTAKLKETLKLSNLSESEKATLVVVALIIGFAIFQSLSKASGSKGRNGLPTFVEPLLSRLLNAEYLECVIGDLHEGYRERLELLPEMKAKFWLYEQVFRSVWPLAQKAARDKLFSWLRSRI